jgi:hypothetical protein
MKPGSVQKGSTKTLSQKQMFWDRLGGPWGPFMVYSSAGGNQDRLMSPELIRNWRAA